MGYRVGNGFGNLGCPSLTFGPDILNKFFHLLFFLCPTFVDFLFRNKCFFPGFCGLESWVKSGHENEAKFNKNTLCKIVLLMFSFFFQAQQYLWIQWNRLMQYSRQWLELYRNISESQDSNPVTPWTRCSLICLTASVTTWVPNRLSSDIWLREQSLWMIIIIKQWRNGSLCVTSY